MAVREMYWLCDFCKGLVEVWEGDEYRDDIEIVSCDKPECKNKSMAKLVTTLGKKVK